ncbi:porin [Pedobacter nyackensis]|uniref:porin n=1 Tax=Pedobacter nyackensis TaxID=475255 RepID=UPI002930A256|nr:porin [Pedobacter nyackensis]
MARFLPLFLLLLVGHSMYAQQEKQGDTTINRNVPLITADKVDLLNNVDVIFNTQVGFNSYFNDGKYGSSKFAVNQFRFEIRGKVFKDKVFFRFRDRYTRDPEVQSIDNLSRSTDLAFIGYTVSDKTSIAIGKMTANWGGYEFDMNPIDIYQYNDFIENSDNFLTGVQFNWKVSSNHALSAQILNSRTKTFTELYEEMPEFKDAKFPAAYVGTWNGSFLEGKFQTIWSFSILQEASRNGSPVNMYYTALGNQLRLKDWLLEYDFKWSSEDLDRTGVVSALIPQDLLGHAAQKTDYKEHWLRAVYSINQQWKASVIGMVSTATWNNPVDERADAIGVRTSWGIIPAVEFYPIKNYNLKFYAAYVGQYLNYSSYAKTTLRQVNSDSGRIMLGITSPLLVF